MNTEVVTLTQLESHLWESANILRGPVDAADFKTYIFPLLFFKRICDVWDDEYQEIMVESGDEQLACFPESHRFQIPDDCHWNDVRSKAANVGSALLRALREIEKANPDSLYGVFGDAQWSNKDRLSDSLLKDLIEHFSMLPLGNSHVSYFPCTFDFCNHFTFLDSAATKTISSIFISEERATTIRFSSGQARMG